VVIETQWERLHRLIERRRKVLGLTLEGIQVVGGPSPRWVQKLRNIEGQPTDRQRRPMRDLDRVLHWPLDTTWGLVFDDRSSWSDDILRDEEEQLMEMVDEVDELLLVVGERLRGIAAGSERDDAMRRVLAALDIRP
jgi:hypothetical protein